MFDAKTLSDGQKAVLYATIMMRKRAPQAKKNIGVAAFITLMSCATNLAVQGGEG